MTNFANSAGGYLTCLECKTYYCDHMKKHFLENKDAVDLWDEFYKVEPGLVLTVMVPILPATQSAWITTELNMSKLLSKTPVLHVMMEDVTDGISLGYIHPGEGRWVLRSMFFTWWHSEDRSNLACTSSSHSLKAENLWRDAIQAGGTWAFRARFTVWKQSVCPTCFDSKITTGTFDEDLIPVDEKVSPY